MKRLVVIRWCLLPFPVISAVYADNDLDTDAIDSSTPDNNLTVCIAVAILYTYAKRRQTRSLTHHEARVIGESDAAPCCPYGMHGRGQICTCFSEEFSAHLILRTVWQLRPTRIPPIVTAL